MVRGGLPRRGPRPAAPWLEGWYAEPLTEARAAQLARRRGGPDAGPVPREAPHAAELNELIGRFWLGRPVTSHYHTLRAGAGGEEAVALVELVMGQLLMSRRLEGAGEHLQAGFDLARPWLPARAYFALLKRHQLLRRLPLSAAGGRASGLADLLLEARVIAQLEGFPSRILVGLGHHDTVG